MLTLRSIRRSILIVAVVAAIFASSALATPRQQQYGNPSPAVSPPSTPPTQPGPTSHVLGTSATSKSGTLPFTGLQLGTAVVVSLGLVGAGLTARRLGAKRKG